MITNKVIQGILGIILISNSCFAYDSVNSTEVLSTVNSVIDKVIVESNFDFTQKPQKLSETVQSVNFKYQFGCGTYGFAYSQISCKEEGEYIIGISTSGKTDIWLNNQKIYSTEQSDDYWFNEYAYDRYRFPALVKVFCNKGNNPFLIRVADSEQWRFYISVLQMDGLVDRRAQFILEQNFNGSNNWMTCASSDSSFLNSSSGEILATLNGAVNKSLIWSSPKIPIVSKVVPKANSSFKKHAYTEWHYANGSMFWSILNYANATQNKKYEAFVKRYCDFTFENIGFFNYQYYDLNENHGFNHRIFRMHMLDDASAPALPFQKLSNMGIHSGAELLNRVEDYVLNKQVRLSDGTFCRPEPWDETVWADDLFMSAPYLMLLGESSGNPKYYDEAASQVLSFYKLLFDSKVGLCHHGWVDSNMKDSIPFWGRANGWVIWAASEVLLKLPPKHKDFLAIQKLFNQHINGFILHQDKDGFIHQIVNDPNSFAETSSTAMLSIAIARGISHGWLPKNLRNNAIKTWQAVNSRIEKSGTVKGICEGTEISTKRDYYLQRKQPDNDPRGLGAVITAGLEIYRMIN